jgi:site-specific DNA-methyltransferase (adenine-specific)
MGAIIWQKVTTCNTTGGATIMGSFPYPRNGILKLDYEFILIFKKQGKAPEVSSDVKEKSKLTTEEWNQYFSGHWNFSGEKQDKHLAVFPKELPYRLIKMFSFVGDTVLDPFLGSGTTTLAAKDAGRNSIGYEINENSLSIIKEKIGWKKDEQCCFFEVAFQRNTNMDFVEEIKKLPYIFKDPISFDKKIDPKKLQFGSKIDQNSTERMHYFTVKKIISPEKVELNNGLQIRLLGIKEDKTKNGKAIEYLEDNIKGKKVFLRYDEIKHDKENNLLCYLYLENKTFINAHLLKKRLADVDDGSNFKYKDKFLSILKG